MGRGLGANRTGASGASNGKRNGPTEPPRKKGGARHGRGRLGPSRIGSDDCGRRKGGSEGEAGTRCRRSTAATCGGSPVAPLPHRSGDSPVVSRYDACKTMTDTRHGGVK